jgi:hypothetical protein
VNLGKRDIVAGVVARLREAVGFVMRLNCWGMRRVVVRSACINELMMFVLMMALRGGIETLIYLSDEFLEASCCCWKMLVVFVKSSSDQAIEA